MTTQPTRRTRRKFTQKQIAVLFVVAGLVLAAFYVVDRVVLNPWSMSTGGRPALSGYWQGTADFTPGGRRNVVVEFRYEFGTGTSRSHSYDPLAGTMKTCGSDGTREAHLFGDSENRSGSLFEVSTSYEGTGPGDYIFDLRGEWEGDRVGMRARYSVQLPEGQYLPSDKTTGSLAFELRRTTKATFEATCPT
ncbi:hypothetical protein [Tenggerimyces flavus]|uniref:Uncharacterized protein n=1 Tax=Tenggerimyces flavus TaxID=1708749 RepID=A0ABV7YQ92_9ACTN|nr:hypothetical protein [Tenggerimyces flavus]MBM7786317.1 hypothetical protein [Tenggerimyces flavus]